MVINTTFNNILVESWRSILLVEETGVSGGKKWKLKFNIYCAQHLYANIEYNCDFFFQEIYLCIILFLNNIVVRPGIKNKNVDIKSSAHDTFLEKLSSGTLKIKRLESELI